MTLEGNTVIGRDCVIRQNTRIKDARIADRVEIESSVILESSIGSGTTVGPFAYLRPHTKVGAGCKVGDFVEMKNSSFGDGSKAAHLTYVGDADVGSGVNLAAAWSLSTMTGRINIAHRSVMTSLSAAIAIWFLRCRSETARISRQAVR